MTWHEAALTLGFLASALLATVAQNMTGFAFGLVLVALCGTFNLVSIADAANSCTLLSLVNAWAFFRSSSEPPPWKLMGPAAGFSAVGVVAGVGLLSWLGKNGTNDLQILLGLSIVASAVLLQLSARPKTRLSSRTSFSVTGFLAGVLGGLFATPGPPIVYFMYRQPLSAEVVRACLVCFFVVVALVRFAAVTISGQLSWRIIALALVAAPLVHLSTRWQQAHPWKLPRQVLKFLVSTLLALSGLGLLWSGLHS